MEADLQGASAGRCAWTIRSGPRKGERCQADPAPGFRECWGHATGERQSRLAVLQACGGNAGLLVLLLDAAVLSGIARWEDFRKLARARGLSL